MRRLLPLLNAIVDVDAAARAGWRPVDLATAFLDGGATFLQLRAKSTPSAEFLDFASAIAERCRAADAILIVNDRADIAWLARAAGVHVGQGDLPPADVKRVMGDEAVIGLSTHTVSQLEAAVRESVGYVAIGPVFGTVTKATGYDAVGLDIVREAAAHARAADRPLVAIGGITLERARSVIDAGASSVAVIGDLLSSGNPGARVRSYLEHLAP